jgi:hypothetical protein
MPPGFFEWAETSCGCASQCLEQRGQYANITASTAVMAPSLHAFSDAMTDCCVWTTMDSYIIVPHQSPTILEELLSAIVYRTGLQAN